MYGRLPQCKSKKKRMRKKMAKKVNVLKMLIEMMNITTPPSYECPKCHKKESFYSAIGSRLVCVEQLGPPAGLIHYMNLKYPKKD